MFSLLNLILPLKSAYKRLLLKHTYLSFAPLTEWRSCHVPVEDLPWLDKGSIRSDLISHPGGVSRMLARIFWDGILYLLLLIIWKLKNKAPNFQI